MTCNVCFGDFSTINLAVDCPSCLSNKSTKVCTECTKDYLLETPQSAHCMSCKHQWSHAFMAKTFNTTFLVGRYRKSRQAKALEREKGLLPQTIHLVEEEKSRREILTRITKLKEELVDLKKQLAGEKQIKKNIYMFPCPQEECRGYIEAKRYKCGICDAKICRKCHTIKEKEHECDDNDIETAKMVKTDTKPCPKCSVRIFKINGCDQMFCTNCHTPFSWEKGTVVTGVIHNPHYYELQNKMGAPPRAAGDIVCGGIPEWFFVEQCLRDHTARGREILPPENTGLALTREYVSCIHRRSAEIQETVRRKRIKLADNGMEKLRISYLIGDISDEESFKKSIFLKERRFEKITEELQILDTFLASMSERFNDLIATSQNSGYNIKRVAKFIKDAEKIRDFCNEAFSATWKAMNYKRIPEIDFNRYYHHNY